MKETNSIILTNTILILQKGNSTYELKTEKYTEALFRQTPTKKHQKIIKNKQTQPRYQRQTKNEHHQHMIVISCDLEMKADHVSMAPTHVHCCSYKYKMVISIMGKYNTRGQGKGEGIMITIIGTFPSLFITSLVMTSVRNDFILTT